MTVISVPSRTAGWLSSSDAPSADTWIACAGSRRRPGL
jgi:hypothetical protein